MYRKKDRKNINIEKNQKVIVQNSGVIHKKLHVDFLRFPKLKENTKFLCQCTPLKSAYMSLHHISPNKSKNNTYRHRSLTGNNHRNSKLSKNFRFEKDNWPQYFFQYFRKSAKNQSPKVEGRALEGRPVFIKFWHYRGYVHWLYIGFSPPAKKQLFQTVPWWY